MRLKVVGGAALQVALTLAAAACTESRIPSSSRPSPSSQGAAAALYWTGTPGDMATPRAQLQLSALSVDGGPLLVTGGVTAVGGAPLATTELFWPDSGTFAPAAPMNVQRARHAAVRLNGGSVLAIGGVTATGISRASEVYTFSADGGEWTTSGQLVNARADHAATVMQDGRVLVTGGLSLNSLPIAAAEWWNGSIWVATLPMSSARAGHSSTLLSDGRVMVIGGTDGTNALNSAEIMNPGLTSWTAAAPMTTRRSKHRAVLLLGTPEKVLVVGGIDGNGVALTSAELYDVASNSWQTVGPLVEARAEHTLTLLPDGGALVVGGVAATTNFLSSAELFTATADGGFWSASGCTAEARAQHGAALLPTGEVLVAGGRNGAVLDSAEVHDPNGGLANGSACLRGCECASQNCVDGVCCDTACGGACDACNLAGSVGTCRSVDAGNPGTPVCAPYLCSGASASCPSSCTVDPDCVSTHRCIGSVCVPRSPNGTPCVGAVDCQSNFCVDGVCCGSICGAACDSCNLPGTEGQCRTTPAGQQGSPTCAPYACNGAGTSCPTSCTTSRECDATHQCVNGACVPRRPNGESCADDAQCVSNFCVDGVCCDNRCNGSCNACNVTGSVGTCTPLEKGAAGSPACGPGRCDGVSVECLMSCSSNADCAAGARCFDGVCTSKPAGYIGWGCSVGDGSMALVGLAALLMLLRRRSRQLGGFLASALIFVGVEARAADEMAAPDGGAVEAAPAARDAPRADAAPAGTATTSTTTRESEGGLIGLLSGLRVGGYLVADVVSQQAGGELQLSYALFPVADVGVAGVLGDAIGLRAIGTFHTPRRADSSWRPFAQVRAVVHPVTRGLGVGGGVWLGATYELGPGRLRGGAMGEVYSGPSSYYPYALVAAVGYEVDPFQSEVRERLVEVKGPTRFKGRITDLDDHVIKGRVVIRSGPEGWTGRALAAEPGFDQELPPGEYEIVAEAEGHLARGRSFQIHPGETVVSDFALRPVPGTKQAQLTDERIEILQSIQFEFDKATILAQSFPILDEVVDILIHHPDLKIRIEGHTDDVGSPEYNQKLSELRAASVRAYLIDKGVSAKRLTSQGYGKARPIAGNDEAGRAKNRRVQFEIVRSQSRAQ